MRKFRKKQQGVALFVTLLVVTIATLIATEMWFSNTLDISRNHNNRSSYQARHYARGMVLWAKDILRQDYENDPAFDSSSDIWNQPISGIIVEDAVLSGKLSDMSSKFNLNNLYINGSFHPISYEFFKRLLRNLQLDVSLADKIVDWLDHDQTPMPTGAEDAIYLSKNPSYRTAGQYFQHISELRLVDGINEDSYQRLKSFVTVLPVQGNIPTRFNINTAPAVLLKSLDDRISQKDAINLFQQGNAIFRTVSDFYKAPAIARYNLSQSDVKILIDSKSQWFQAQSIVQMESAIFQKFALMLRNSNNSSIVQWSDTPFYD